jgi:hypothetical protein
LDNTVGIVVAGAAAGYAAGKGWFDKAADFIFSGAAPTPGAGSEMPGPLLGEKPLLTENVSEKPNMYLAGDERTPGSPVARIVN